MYIKVYVKSILPFLDAYADYIYTYFVCINTCNSI